jgi:hypothetical protein
MHADVAADALVDLIRAAVPGVQVSPGLPAEDQQGIEAVWIEEVDSEFEWRALGTHPGNRSEQIAIKVVIHTYREAEDQQSAQAAARARSTEIERAIEEQAVGTTGDLNATVTFALVSQISRRDRASDNGWARRSELTITATNYP